MDSTPYQPVKQDVFRRKFDVAIAQFNLVIPCNLKGREVDFYKLHVLVNQLRFANGGDISYNKNSIEWRRIADVLGYIGDVNAMTLVKIFNKYITEGYEKCSVGLAGAGVVGIFPKTSAIQEIKKPKRVYRKRKKLDQPTHCAPRHIVMCRTVSGTPVRLSIGPHTPGGEHTAVSTISAQTDVMWDRSVLLRDGGILKKKLKQQTVPQLIPLPPLPLDSEQAPNDKYTTSECHVTTKYLVDDGKLPVPSGRPEKYDIFPILRQLDSELPHEIQYALNMLLLLTKTWALPIPKYPRLVNMLLANTGLPPKASLYAKYWEDEKMSTFWQGTQQDEQFFNEGSNSERIRAVQISVILNNVCQVPSNALFLANNVGFIDYLMQALSSSCVPIRNNALNACVALACELELRQMCDYTQLLSCSLGYFKSQDRYVLISGLEIISNLCSRRDNHTFLLDHMTLDTYQTMLQILLIPDVQTVHTALETIYNLTSIGPDCCEKFLSIRHSITTLIRLFQCKAESLEHAGVKVIRYRDITQSTTAAAPAKHTQSDDKVVFLYEKGPTNKNKKMKNKMKLDETAVTCLINTSTGQAILGSDGSTITLPSGMKTTIQFAQSWIRENIKYRKDSILLQCALYTKYIKAVNQTRTRNSECEVISAKDFFNILIQCFPKSVRMRICIRSSMQFVLKNLDWIKIPNFSAVSFSNSHQFAVKVRSVPSAPTTPVQSDELQAPLPKHGKTPKTPITPKPKKLKAQIAEIIEEMAITEVEDSPKIIEENLSESETSHDKIEQRAASIQTVPRVTPHKPALRTYSKRKVPDEFEKYKKTMKLDLNGTPEKRTKYSPDIFDSVVQNDSKKSLSPVFDNAPSPTFDTPASPTFDKPSSPVFVKSLSPKSSPKFEKPGSPTFDEQGSPTFDNPSSPKFDKPSSPTFEPPKPTSIIANSTDTSSSVQSSADILNTNQISDKPTSPIFNNQPRKCDSDAEVEVARKLKFDNDIFVSDHSAVMAPEHHTTTSTHATNTPRKSSTYQTFAMIGDEESMVEQKSNKPVLTTIVSNHISEPVPVAPPQIIPTEQDCQTPMSLIPVSISSISYSGIHGPQNMVPDASYTTSYTGIPTSRILLSPIQDAVPQMIAPVSQTGMVHTGNALSHILAPLVPTLAPGHQVAQPMPSNHMVGQHIILSPQKLQTISSGNIQLVQNSTQLQVVIPQQEHSNMVLYNTPTPNYALSNQQIVQISPQPNQMILTTPTRPNQVMILPQGNIHHNQMILTPQSGHVLVKQAPQSQMVFTSPSQPIVFTPASSTPQPIFVSQQAGIQPLLIGTSAQPIVVSHAQPTFVAASAGQVYLPPPSNQQLVFNPACSTQQVIVGHINQANSAEHPILITQTSINKQVVLGPPVPQIILVSPQKQSILPAPTSEHNLTYVVQPNNTQYASVYNPPVVNSPQNTCTYTMANSLGKGNKTLVIMDDRKQLTSPIPAPLKLSQLSPIKLINGASATYNSQKQGGTPKNNTRTIQIRSYPAKRPLTKIAPRPSASGTLESKQTSPFRPTSTCTVDAGDHQLTVETPKHVTRKRKIEIPYSKYSYPCYWGKCGRGYSTEKELATHLLTDHVTECPHSCQWITCQEKENTRSRYCLIFHLKNIHARAPLLPELPECTYTREKVFQMMSLPRPWTDDVETPITRSLRLLTSLIIRNFVYHTPELLLNFEQFEDVFAILAMSSSEAGRVSCDILEFTFNNPGLHIEDDNKEIFHLPPFR